MTTRKRKNYTLEERAEFHKKRAHSESCSSNQQTYSLNWLDGYNDEHADKNLRAAKMELAERKKSISVESATLQAKTEKLREKKIQNKVVFGAYINGAKAQQKSVINKL